MQKISYICDRCGKDTFEIRGKFKAAYVSNQTDTARTDITSVETLDFCDKCFEELLDLLENKEQEQPVETEEVNLTTEEVEEPEQDVYEAVPEKYPAKKKENESKRKVVDWPKAVALKKAGWTHAKIADELGPTLATINVGIYKHL